MYAHQQDPERWQSGRMHRIRNPAYRFTCTEGSNPSLSAKQFNEYASHEAFLFCIHTSTHRTLPCRLCRFSGFGARFDREGGVHWYGVLE